MNQDDLGKDILHLAICMSNTDVEETVKELFTPIDDGSDDEEKEAKTQQKPPPRKGLMIFFNTVDLLKTEHTWNQSKSLVFGSFQYLELKSSFPKFYCILYQLYDTITIILSKLSDKSFTGFFF